MEIRGSMRMVEGEVVGQAFDGEADGLVEGGRMKTKVSKM